MWLGCPYHMPFTFKFLGICTPCSLCLEHTSLPSHLFILLTMCQSRSLQLKVFFKKKKKVQIYQCKVVRIL